jgi:acetyl esterase/lipase
MTPLAEPIWQQPAIRLSGHTKNPAPELWVRMEDGLPPGAGPTGVAKLGRPELWVWNVSEPTLTPFLPERSQASGAAMIVLPGGAFMGLAIDREGFDVAHWLNQRGITAFVLKYRVAPLPADPQQALTRFSNELASMMQRAQTLGSGAGLAQMQSPEVRAATEAAREDGLEAVRFVRTHAAQWGIDPHRIGVVGFSAGAITAAGLTLTADAASRPDLVAPIYGMLPRKQEVPNGAPPAFFAVAADDMITTAAVAAFQAWRANGAVAELHVLESGGHGFGVLQQGKSSDQWTFLFDHWLTTRGFVSPQVSR